MLMIEEEEKLLPRDTLTVKRKRTTSTSWRVITIALGVYIFALHVALVVSLTGLSNVYETPKTRLQKLRAHLQSVKSNEHEISFTDYSRYSGPPNVENSEAWKGLLQNLYLNATKDEVITEGGDPETNIQVKGGGYLAALGVHHELHCLNKMRYFLYSHKTQQLWTEEDMGYWYRHLDHCVEVLRLSVMCNSDLSLYTFTWPKDNASEFLDLHSKSERTCADWSQIEEWSRDKRTSLQKGLLVPETAFES